MEQGSEGERRGSKGAREQGSKKAAPERTRFGDGRLAFVVLFHALAGAAKGVRREWAVSLPRSLAPSLPRFLAALFPCSPPFCYYQRREVQCGTRK
jgi:hypothetical protein